MTDVIVIGAGPAGALAATFLARAGLSTLVLDSDQGVTRRAWVANHLGFPDGISGPDLVRLGHEQIAKAGARLVTGKAVGLAQTEGGFEVRLDDEQTLTARQVLLATGFMTDLAKSAGIRIVPGTEPRVKEIVEVDDQGRTSLPGVWAAGTSAGVSVHVTITAADGARVAINLISEQKGERWVDHEVLKTS